MIPTKVDVTNAVQELEKRLLPGLHEVAEEISKQFPRVKVTVWSLPVGSLTDCQGHDLGIDCVFADARPEQTDNLALSVEISHLTTAPLIDAGLCWGHPSGQTEAELFPDPIELTRETLQELEARLPILYDALKRAIRRGHPPDET